MTQRTLSAADQQKFRDLLQSATLGALMDSRRWEPGDLAFQGGTCLHLAYGSARFSEDLDFMIRGGLSLVGLGAAVQQRLQGLQGVPADMKVTVTSSRDARNPHAFMVTLGGAHVIGSAKVKVELWQARSSALESLKLVVKPISSVAGMTAFVPTLTLDEILADKVYALGARTRLKARDVFDLWWLCQQVPAPELGEADLCVRPDIYPVADGDWQSTARQWLINAPVRWQELSTTGTVRAVEQDLKRWLPSSWRMNEDVARQMLAVAQSQLQGGITLMAARLARYEAAVATVSQGSTP